MHVTRLFAILLVSFFISATADSLAQTIRHVPLYTFHGDDAGDGFGRSVSSAGDVNGDGKADLIIGANWDDNNGADSGSVRVLSGSDGSILYNFNGDNEGDNFGRSVSGAGDVNGDGTPDLIIGTLFDDNNGDDSGSACVLSGSDGSVLYSFDGDSPGDNFGWSVSGAGDINGDGTPDLIIGAPHNDADSGSVRVLSGGDGSVLYNFNGDSPGDNFGKSVSGAGDVNGDGTPDLIVGAHRDDNNGGDSGSVRVLSGSDGSVLYNFDGDSPGDWLGVPVSSAGDVNGDGTPDLIAGAYFDDNNGASSGSARVLSGSDGSVLYNFDGDSPGDWFGKSVSGAGDVNRDGRADLIVGAWFDDDNGANSGSVRVLSGSDGSVLYNFDGDSSGDNFGVSASDAGDVNGDGIDDFIAGARYGGANGGGYARVFVSQIAKLGDCNRDGGVDFLDIAPFISVLSAGEYLAEADINGDGAVSFLDISPFIELLTS